MKVKTPTRLFARPGEKSPVVKPQEVKRRTIKMAYIPLSSVHIDISNSTVKDFTLLERFSKLASIDARNTLIQNVQSAPLHPNLEYISLDDSPITKLPYYRLMLLCTIGTNIKSIDAESVSNEERKQGEKYLPLIQKYLYDGYTIKSLDPLVLTRGETEIEIDPENGEKSDISTIKVEQTTAIITEFAKQVNEVKSEMGLDNKTVVVDEIMTSPKKIDYAPYLSPSKFNQPEVPQEMSPFEKAFTRHLSPKDYLKANDLYNSPQKRRETHMEITTMMESRLAENSDLDLLSTPKQGQNYDEASELDTTEITPAVAEAAELIDTNKSVAEIFKAASFLASPQKAIEAARKSTKAKSKIPLRVTSPVKSNYEEFHMIAPLSPVLKSIVMEEEGVDIEEKERQFRRELHFFPSPKKPKNDDPILRDDLSDLEEKQNEEEEEKNEEKKEETVEKSPEEEEEKKEEETIENQAKNEEKKEETVESDEKNQEILENSAEEEEEKKEETVEKQIENDKDEEKKEEVGEKHAEEEEIKEKVEEIKEENNKAEEKKEETDEKQNEEEVKEDMTEKSTEEEEEIKEEQVDKKEETVENEEKKEEEVVKKQAENEEVKDNEKNEEEVEKSAEEEKKEEETVEKQTENEEEVKNEEKKEEPVENPEEEEEKKEEKPTENEEKKEDIKEEEHQEITGEKPVEEEKKEETIEEKPVEEEKTTDTAVVPTEEKEEDAQTTETSAEKSNEDAEEGTTAPKQEEELKEQVEAEEETPKQEETIEATEEEKKEVLEEEKPKEEEIKEETIAETPKEENQETENAPQEEEIKSEADE
ncbi:ribonuclease inhibitor domain-containing protein [Trichomonas vaginalis G3]|uniref:ribonuclease inhibitor domain-containing protein n=1 Tax=Trichomonas vaginalis (strain ATCC PRA-98 / G3) TaxID=412133 RepID=UPI0021E53F21|nr:ribonuclease inhibitor domain-containing protein [Trichomonas vaginalis G3]KAI5548031.1 ribonuclease inhibitor domain-containing protein [Trichomonas vaginalis G3]